MFSCIANLCTRAVYLNSQDGALLLVDQTLWFELYFAGEIQKFPLMFEAVEESSHHLELANRMNIRGYGELMHGIQCPHVSCDAPFIHPRIILPQSSMAECTMREANCHQNRSVGSTPIQVSM